MRQCRKFQGDLAAALYEALAPAAQRQLDRHLEACLACRAEAEALRALVGGIPRERAMFEGDLLPALRAELAQPTRSSGFSWRRLAPVGAMAAALLVAVSAWYAANRPDLEVEPRVAQSGVDVPGGVETEAVRLARTHIAKAGELEAEGDFMGARSLLTKQLESAADGAAAGALQLALADLEYGHGDWYAEAYAAYETVKREYPETWAASSDAVKNRCDLLAEAREDGFKSLEALDAADTFEDYEKVLGRYPTRELVAARAVSAMAAEVGEDAMGAPGMRVTALEAVRMRCTEPIAVAQLNVTLGDLYWKELNKPQQARARYADAANGPHLVLAQRAKTALSELDGAARR